MVVRETKAGVLKRGPWEDRWLLVSGMLDVESQRVQVGSEGVWAVSFGISSQDEWRTLPLPELSH